MKTGLQEEICLSSCLLNLTTNSHPIINILRYHQIFWIVLVLNFVEILGLLLWNTFAQKLVNKVLFCNWNCLDIVVRIVFGGTLTANLCMSCNFFSLVDAKVLFGLCIEPVCRSDFNLFSWLYSQIGLIIYVMFWFSIVIIALSFQHPFFSPFFHFSHKNKKSWNSYSWGGEKKCQTILHYLSTPYQQAF